MIKLIGSFRYEKGVPAIYVCPQMVKKDDILAGVDDVYNAIRVRCSVTGDVMFYGRGAGRFPTAGAVTADIVAALSGAAAAEHAPVFTKKSGSAADFDRVRFSYYIRLAGASPSDAKEDLSRYFDRVEPVPGSPAGKAEFICGEASGKELRAFLSSRENVESVIRLAEQIG